MPDALDTPVPLFGPDAVLIVACSQRKRMDQQLLPAIERYDGPFFRLLRRFLAQQADVAQRIYVLSAQYGLLPCDQAIPAYDRRMTQRRAQELRPMMTSDIREVMLRGLYQRLFVSVGCDYMPALAESLELMSAAGQCYIADGSVGRRLSQIHDWLYGHPPKTPSIRPERGHPTLRGVGVQVTADQLLDRARERFEDDRDVAQNYQSWYVVVDEHYIAPKWLVSQATGLPVKAFTTDEARRFLAHVGVPVHRVP